jgi:hypothetical protein
MSSAGRAANSSGCVARPRAREIGLIGFAAQIRRSSLTGSYVMETAEHREPCESRGSRTVLGAPGGEIPPGDSTNPDPSFSARMSPSAECGHCHVRRPRRPKRRASATGLEVPAAPERRTTAGCRPLLEYRTPADWSGASGQTDDAEALCELRPCVRRRANSSPPPRP